MSYIELRNITKTFGEVIANDDVTLSIEEGEVLSILGENGSGKTTLLNVLDGIYTPDSGKIFIRGKEVSIKSPKDAHHHRIGMVHQHYKLVEAFNSVENVALGQSRKELLKSYDRFLTDEEKADIQKWKDMKPAPKNPDSKFSCFVASMALKCKKVIHAIAHYRRTTLKQTEKYVSRMCHRYHFAFDPWKRVSDMSVAEKQTLEIVKAIFRGIDTLILDEPTAVLTPQETQQLFVVIRRLIKHGKTVIIITHKLNEVLEISDRVAVLRKGRYVGSIATKDADEMKLAEMMVGQKMDLDIKRSTVPTTGDRLVVKNLTVKNREGRIVLDDATFTVHGSEILGIAGVSGSGQKELLDAIAGLAMDKVGSVIFTNPKKNRPVTFYHKDIKQIRELATQGKFYHADTHETIDLAKYSNKEVTDMVMNKKIIFYDNEIIDITNKKPLEIRDYGIKLSFVPEDRLGMGLVGSMDLVDNMLLRSYRKGKGRLLHKEKSQALAKRIVEELEVKTPSLHTSVSKLSGGNIQKLLVGREISSDPKILMVAYPVRGLDIHSSYLIYSLLDKQKQRGCAIIYVGEDLDAMLALTDRILVLCDGKITGIVDSRTTTKEQIGLLMSSNKEGGTVDGN